MAEDDSTGENVDEPLMTRNPPGWIRVATVLPDTVLDGPLNGEGWRMYPFALPDPTTQEAIRIYSEELSGHRVD
jgi:hypothetical protein